MPSFHATMKTSEAENRMLLFISVVPNELSQAVEQVARDAVLNFASFAPRGRSGAIGRGIRYVDAQGRLSTGRFATGRQFVIIAEARNQGYDYVGVSRFGHRLRMIFPRHDRGPASVVSTRKARRVPKSKKALAAAGTPGQKAALRIERGSPQYQHSVRGIIRKVDWAAEAQSSVNRELDAQAKRLANNLERRFG